METLMVGSKVARISTSIVIPVSLVVLVVNATVIFIILQKLTSQSRRSEYLPYVDYEKKSKK